MKNINVLLKGAAKLNKQEMKNVKGGSRDPYCDSLQEWANTHYDNPEMIDGYWDDWADKWEKYCS